MAQTKQSLDNMAAILKAANSGMDKVVKTTILLADIKDFPKVNEVYATCQHCHTHTAAHSSTQQHTRASQQRKMGRGADE